MTATSQSTNCLRERFPSASTRFDREERRENLLYRPFLHDMAIELITISNPCTEDWTDLVISIVSLSPQSILGFYGTGIQAVAISRYIVRDGP